MTYQAFIDELAFASQLTKATTRDVMVHFVDMVESAMIEQGRLSIPGFGVFTKTTRKARRVMNPSTKQGAAAFIDVPKTTSVRFRPAAEFKRRLR